MTQYHLQFQLDPPTTSKISNSTAKPLCNSSPILFLDQVELLDPTLNEQMETRNTIT